MTKWKEWLLLILLAIFLRLAVNLVLPDLPNEGKFVLTVLVGIGVILMVHLFQSQIKRALLNLPKNLKNLVGTSSQQVVPKLPLTMLG